MTTVTLIDTESDISSDRNFRESGSLAEQLQRCTTAIPEPLVPAFAPARRCLSEWQDHWLNLPGVDHLRVGQEWVHPIAGTWFNLRFENRIGLTSVQPFAGGQPLTTPIYIEVVSTKFPTPTLHLSFYEALLTDLYLRAAKLPFTIKSPTEVKAAEAIRPPLPLFTLHFFCQYSEVLLSAVKLIQAAPHRCLTDLVMRVPLFEATEAGPDVVMDILHHPDEWQASTAQLQIVRRLRGMAPDHVAQNCPDESFDTPENRFVRHFLSTVLSAADALPTQAWWPHVPKERQNIIGQCRAVIREALLHAPLRDLGAMHVLPLNSQTLLRRDGYRDMLSLWQRFQQARRPLFSCLQHAIDVRDIATLYEIWAYFALADDIADLLGVKPVLGIEATTQAGLAWGATANYGEGRTLVYNRSFYRPASYSVVLRPDYTYLQNGRPTVVFDAKFALDRLGDADKDKDAATTAKRRDLYKMHTYRDALGIRSAVALYPGTETSFYSCAGPVEAPVTLGTILFDDVHGVGALPYCPQPH